MRKRRWLFCLACALLPGAPGQAQEDESETGALSEKQIRKIVEKTVQDEYSKGIVTIGGAELKLGGKIELNFVDTQNEGSSVPGGPTDSPDPRLILDRLRIEPELDIGRGLEIQGQLDFLPAEGETFIKEAVLHHQYEHEWWFELDTQIGVDDRFIHLGPDTRLTESYPLIGTAFWRDEETAIMFAARLGHKRGRKPTKEVQKKYEEFMPYTDSELWYGPFDFSENPGAFTLHFSLGGGSELAGKSVIKDTADMQEIIQDNRKVEGNLALRDVGIGLEYERDFSELGEISLLAFYYDDRLDGDSVDFLQQNLTDFDPLTNQPLAGYGLSQSSYKQRVGVTLRYHLEAFHLLYRSGIDTEPGDGLYLMAQYIDARDGMLDRDGFFVQASYRYSFQAPLVGDYYFRYIEPVVRYGELNTDARALVNKPWSWDRDELVFGAVAGLTKRILFKAEYVISGEDTGGPDIDNNELLLQILVNF